MKKIIFLSTLLLLISCGKGFMSSACVIDQGITISSQGEATSSPDQIQISFSLGSLKSTAEEAVSALEEKHESVINLLAGAGITPKDLKMTGYNLVAEYRWDEISHSQVIVGFRSNKDFSLSLDFNEEMAGKIYNTLSKVPSSDSTFFSFNVYFGLKDPSSLEQEALATAIAKAKSDAEFIANSAGIRLAGIMSIKSDQATDCLTAYNGEITRSSFLRMNRAGAIAPINAEDIKITRNVIVIWRLLGY